MISESLVHLMTRLLGLAILALFPCMSSYHSNFHADRMLRIYICNYDMSEYARSVFFSCVTSLLEGSKVINELIANFFSNVHVRFFMIVTRIFECIKYNISKCYFIEQHEATNSFWTYLRFNHLLPPYALRVSVQNSVLHLIILFESILSILKVCLKQNLPRNFGLQFSQNIAVIFACLVLHFGQIFTDSLQGAKFMNLVSQVVQVILVFHFLQMNLIFLNNIFLSHFLSSFSLIQCHLMLISFISPLLFIILLLQTCIAQICSVVQQTYFAGFAYLASNSVNMSFGFSSFLTMKSILSTITFATELACSLVISKFFCRISDTSLFASTILNVRFLTTIVFFICSSFYFSIRTGSLISILFTRIYDQYLIKCTFFVNFALSRLDYIISFGKRLLANVNILKSIDIASFWSQNIYFWSQNLEPKLFS